MSVAAAFVIRLQGCQRPAGASSDRGIFGSITLGIVGATATWLFSVVAPPPYSLTGPPFFVLTGLIIVGAFALIACYGWQLEAIDWSADPENRT
jgi:hypothetical protein